MKYLLVALSLVSANAAFAQETCEVVKQDVNTPVPYDLKEAKIIVRTKDGKEVEMRAEEFKVVPRKQQFKVVKQAAPCKPVVVEKIVEVEAKQKKNMIIGGLSRDYTDISVDTSTAGNITTLKTYSNKGPIFDIGYMRRRLFDTNFAGGLSINSNVAPRVFVGYEF